MCVGGRGYWLEQRIKFVSGRVLNLYCHDGIVTFSAVSELGAEITLTVAASFGLDLSVGCLLRMGSVMPSPRE